MAVISISRHTAYFFFLVRVFYFIYSLILPSLNLRMTNLSSKSTVSLKGFEVYNAATVSWDARHCLSPAP